MVLATDSRRDVCAPGGTTPRIVDRADKAESELAEARVAADEALEMAREATGVAGAAVTRAEGCRATLSRVEALVAEKKHPDQYVFVGDIWAALKPVEEKA